jgi:hypothetical protein
MGKILKGGELRNLAITFHKGTPYGPRYVYTLVGSNSATRIYLQVCDFQVNIQRYDFEKKKLNMPYKQQ